MAAENTNHGSAPACPGPAPNPRRPTRYAVPAGAVDTHAHVIGLPPDYPFVEGRAYTPPAAPPSAYLGMLDGTGMTYGVLIQVSVHGTDNRLMLDTLRANRQRLRGIAVAPLGLPDKAYRDMKETGIVGLRAASSRRAGVRRSARRDVPARTWR
jgi:predicted TIM-barrel fold metal-dependent hydrolase